MSRSRKPKRVPKARRHLCSCWNCSPAERAQKHKRLKADAGDRYELLPDGHWRLVRNGKEIERGPGPFVGFHIVGTSKPSIRVKRVR